jgi:hypothetical protein
MASFFVKVFETLSAPSQEDEQLQKQRVYLLKGLKQTSKRVLSNSSVGENAGRIRSTDPFAEQLCNDILACLRHGLKGRGKDGFWGFINECCKRVLSSSSQNSKLEPFLDSVQAVGMLDFVKTPEGKSRAWVRQALNTKAMADAIEEMIRHQPTLILRYEPWSLLRCSTGNRILVSIIAPLAIFDFCFDVDIALLDHQDFPSLPEELIIASMASAKPPGRASRSTSQAEQELQNKLWESKRAGGSQVRRKRSASDGGGVTNLASSAFSFLSRAAHTITKDASSALDVIIDGMSNTKRLRQKCGFEMNLSLLVRSQRHCRHALLEPRLGVPRIAEQCFNALESQLDTKGLFQVSPPEAEVLALKEAYSTGRSLPVGLFSAHAIGGLLIAFLSSIPHCLVPPLHRLPLIVCATEIEEVEARDRNIGFRLQELPWAHRPLFRKLVEFFRRVVSPEHSALNGTSPMGVAGLLAHIMFDIHGVETIETLDGSLETTDGKTGGPRTVKKTVPKMSSSEIEKAIQTAHIILTGRDQVLAGIKEKMAQHKQSLDGKVLYLRQTYEVQFKPFNAQSPSHVSLLRKIWDLLLHKVEGPMPSPLPPFSLQSGMWSRFGFRGSDPTIDLRGGGIYALQQLVYLYTNYTEKILFLLRWHEEVSNNRALHAYPMVITFVRCARIVTEVTGLQPKATGASASDTFSLNSLCNGPCWRLFDHGSSSMGELCAFAFLLHDRHWRKQDAHFVDYDRLLEETKHELTGLLTRRPSDTKGLWKLWIDDNSKKEFGGGPRGELIAETANAPSIAPAPAVQPAPEGIAPSRKGSRESLPDSPVRKRVPTMEQGPGSPLLSSSFILQPDHVSFLVENALPITCKDYSWVRAFSLGSDGKSFTNFQRKIKSHMGSILVIKDSTGRIFGGYASEPWGQNQEGYYGTGECFVFSLDPARKAYKWTSKNNLCMMLNETAIAMGGGGSFAFYLDRDLYRGSSGPCETFGCPNLAGGDGKFFCVDLEVWYFTSETVRTSPSMSGGGSPSSMNLGSLEI